MNPLWIYGLVLASCALTGHFIWWCLEANRRAKWHRQLLLLHRLRQDYPLAAQP